MTVLLILVALPLSACAKQAENEATLVEPAKVETVQGTSLKRVVLVKKAAERIGIKTAPVRDLPRYGGDTQRKVVDYAAIVYDPDGATAVYTNPEPRVFVRKLVTVDYIEGGLAVLSDGPEVGTQVVVVGAQELLGVETGIGEFE